MATVNDISVLNGILKKVYGNEVVDTIPDDLTWLFQSIPFDKKDVIGDSFNEAVMLKAEQGFATASGTAGRVQLPTPSTSVVKQATVDALQLLGQTNIAWSIIAKALGTNTAASFKNTMSIVMDSMLLGHRRRQAMHMLYGGSQASPTVAGVGTLGVVKTGANSATQTLTEATGAPGIWYGSHGLTFDIYDPTLATKRNGSPLELVSYDVDAAAITLTFGASVNTTTSDVIVPAGTITTAASNETMGLEVMAATVGSDSYFGIDQDDYPTFQAAQYNVDSAALTQTKLGQAAARLVNRGIYGKVYCMVHPYTFNGLVNEQSGRTMFVDNRASGKVTVGFDTYEMKVQSGITVNLISTPWCKAGEAIMWADSADIRRIGTQDIKLGGPLEGSEVVFPEPGYTSFLMNSYSFQTPFTARPNHIVFLYGIVNA